MLVKHFCPILKSTYQNISLNAKIETKGCLFHFGKAIWKRVTDHGMKRYYSQTSDEPKFGHFIRLILGK